MGNALLDNELGTRRRGKFIPGGCRRGVHGVTRPTALGTRQGLAISGPASEFGFKFCGYSKLIRQIALPFSGWRCARSPSPAARRDPAEKCFQRCYALRPGATLAKRFQVEGGRFQGANTVNTLLLERVGALGWPRPAGLETGATGLPRVSKWSVG